MTNGVFQFIIVIVTDGKIRIGVILDYLCSEYSENLLNGISSFCKENDVELLVYTIGEINSSTLSAYNYQNLAVAALIKKENIDGMIIDSGTQLHGISKKEYLSYLRSYKSIPMVNISMPLPGIPSISVDCTQAFDSMIQYLIDEQKCTKLALMGVESNSYEVKTRTEIFKNVLKRNGLYNPKKTVVWKSTFEYSTAYRELSDYYRKHKKFDFDAIVALNDETAFACIDFVQNQLKMKVPQDIIVTGFDDLQRASFTNPTLTSVNQQVSTQGYLAAQTLFKILNNEKVAEIQEIDAKTVIRQSSNRYKPSSILKYKKNKFITFENHTARDINNRFSVSEWYNRRSQLLTAAYFYSRIDQKSELFKMGATLTKELKNYGFQTIAIVIYDKPVEMENHFEYFNLPHKAKIIGGFDCQTDFDVSVQKKIITFDPNEIIIPKGLISFSNEELIVISLFHETIQYGYLILNRGNYDNGVYDLVAKAIAVQIASCYSYSSFMEEKSEFTDKYHKLDLIAHTDELTGLWNRRGFIDFGQATLNFAEADNSVGLLIFCDMDGLKKINDTYGHEAGDEAIKAQAMILKKNFRSNDVLARLGGDEFAVIVPEITEERFLQIKNQIEKSCLEWTEKNNSPFALSISMGYCVYPDSKNGYELVNILSDADSSLYQEKRRKKMEKKNSKI